MEQNNSEENNFQHYVDLVKQNKFEWNIFVNVIQHLTYSDMYRLRILNAILLNELTTTYSDMDKLKYLNEILLIEFKNKIQRGHNMTQNEDHEKFVDTNVHEETNDEFIDDLISLPKVETTEINPIETTSKALLSNFHDEKDDQIEDNG